MRTLIVLLLLLACPVLLADEVDQLIEKLGSDDYKSRKDAYLRLAKMCPDVEKRLKEALPKANAQARYSITKLLRMCRIRRCQMEVESLLMKAGVEEKHAKRLAAMLFGVSRRSREAALLSIARGAPKTLPALFAAITEQPKESVLAALIVASYACASAGDVPRMDLFKLLYERRPGPPEPPEFVSGLLKVADFGDVRVAEMLAGLGEDGRELAAGEARLAISKNPAAVATLLRLALDKSARVRERVTASLLAAASLCRQFDLPEKCAEWAKKAMESKQERLRHAVAEVVARCRSEWAKKMALSFFDDPDDAVVTCGIEAAGRWKLAEAVPRLSVLVLEARFVVAAAEALGRIGTDEAVGALQKAALESSTPYRGPIYNALIKLNPEAAATTLLEALVRLKTPQEKREVQNYLCGLFARSFGKKQEQALLAVLHSADSDPAAALVAAELLAQFGSKRAERALCEMLKTQNRLIVVKPCCLMRGVDEARKWLIMGGPEAERAAHALAVLGNAAPMLRLTRLPKSLSGPPQKTLRDLAATARVSLIIWHPKIPSDTISFSKGEDLHTVAEKLAKSWGLQLHVNVGFGLVASKENLARLLTASIRTDGTLKVERMLATLVLAGGTLEHALGQLSPLFAMRVESGVLGRRLPLYGVLLDVRVVDALRLLSAAADVEIRIEKGALVVGQKKKGTPK